MNINIKKFNEEFSKIKVVILIRDKFQCQGEYENFHFGNLTVDHIRKRSKFGSNHKTNLITLCQGCHSIYESLPAKIKEEKLYRILNEKYGYKEFIKNREMKK